MADTKTSKPAEEVHTFSDDAPVVIKENNGTSAFVYMDDVKNVLEIALETEENVILYGPGGYGKSEFTLDFLKEKDIEPYIITMGSGMTTDRLFGGMEMITFHESGRIEYLVENSFMNHEYVIFEELFDAPDFILEQLKDILSSGIFRNGNQIFPIKTKVIFCCTNKLRNEFAKDQSLKALMERFPLEQEVKWKSHTAVNYDHLFQTKFGVSDDLLCFILEEYAASNLTISPRIAIKSFKIFNKCGQNAIKYVADFSQNQSILQKAIKAFKSQKDLIDLKEEYDKAIKEVEQNLKVEDLIAAVDSLKTISTIQKKIGKLSVSDSMISKVQAITTKIKDDLVSYTKQIDLLKATQST